MKQTSDRVYYMWLTIAIIIAMVSVFGMSSCKSAQHYADAFDKLKNKAEASKKDEDHHIPAEKCAQWYPVVPNTVTNTITTEGPLDTLYLPGNIVYINCDSVKAAGGSKVAIPCPPTKIIHQTDTVKTVEVKTVENTAMVADLSIQLTSAKNKVDEVNSSMQKYRKVSEWEGGILLLIIVATAYKIWRKTV